MNYTEKYHLPQWEETDRIMRTDFNQMCADIEEGIAEAKSTADTARTEAAVLPYVIGSYTGNGVSIRDIYTGFRPKFVIVCYDQVTGNPEFCGKSLLMTGGGVNVKRIILTDTGFRLDTSDTLYKYPDANVNGRLYNYIAFR